MKQPKYRWIFTAHNADRESREFKILELWFRLSVRKDSAEDLAQVVREGGRADYYKEKAEEIRRATRKTEYWDDQHDQEFSVRFQANLGGTVDYNGTPREPSDWYGMRLDSGNITDHVAKAITAIAKACNWEASPAQAIAALHAVPVRYLDSHVFVDADLTDKMESPKTQADKEKAEKASAA